MEEYHFAFGVDANYVKYVGVVMTSIVLNHPGQPVTFHLICDRLLVEDKGKLDTFTQLYRNTRIFIYDAHEMLQKIPRVSDSVAPERLNQTVFLRILMPMLLPVDLTRVIYCDADMLCLGRADALWRLDLKGHPLAAAMEGGHEEKAKRLGLQQQRYFNAGFMVIDLERWRQLGLTPNVLDCYQRKGAAFSLLEQDALNKVLDGDWLEMSPYQVYLMDAFDEERITPMPENIFWHFLNEGKPWIPYCAERIAKTYWSYVRRSLWYELEPTEPWEARITLMAGKNARRRGCYEDAARYLEAAADRLMEFYLEQKERQQKEAH